MRQSYFTLKHPLPHLMSGLLQLCLIILGSMIVARGQTNPSDPIHNSPWTDAEVQEMTQPGPGKVTEAQKNKGLIPLDAATRYSGFSSRLGTWLSSDNYFWWNFSTANRAEAQDAFWTIANESFKTPLVWTGSLAKQDPGTTNAEFRASVYRFINYNRYLYHGQSRVRFIYEEPKFLAMTQAAALVQALNVGKFSHTVTADWIGYNDLARQGSANSDLGAGIYEVPDWSDYMVDYGVPSVGHRLWQLNPYATSVAVGSMKNDWGSGLYGYDATWVDRPSTYVDRNLQRDPIKSVAYYPYPGFVPSPLLETAMIEEGKLTFSASFEAYNTFLPQIVTPAITVKKDGVVLPVIQQYWVGQTLCYQVDISTIKKGQSNWETQFSSAVFGADQKFEVTIKGIQFEGWTTPHSDSDNWYIDPAALQPRTVSYSFTVFNPEKVQKVELMPRSQVQGLSTRATVGQGDKVLIAGLSITGNEPIRVMLSAKGQSLKAAGIQSPAGNPKIEIHELRSGRSLGSNDSWKDSSNWRLVQSLGFAPDNDNECAAIATLAPGLYTATVSDATGANGIGLVEAYAIDAQSASQLNGVSTRGILGQGEAAMISGLVLQKETTVVVSAKGPSLASAVSGTVADPSIRIIPIGADTPVASNDDWDVPANARLHSDLAWAAPQNAKEAACVVTLPAGAYTVVAEAKGSPGVGIVEIYRSD